MSYYEPGLPVQEWVQLVHKMNLGYSFLPMIDMFLKAIVKELHAISLQQGPDSPSFESNRDPWQYSFNSEKK